MGFGEVTHLENTVLNQADPYTDGQRIIPLSDVSYSGGTWTLTRNAASDYSMKKTAGAATTYIMADITDLLRTTSNKGLKLTTITLAYKIATAALTTHSLAVNSVTYVNNTANAVATFGGTLSGTLATATQTNPYVTTLTLGTPVFLTGANQKVNLELTIVDPGTTVYDFYNIVLGYSHNYI
jgi:hypothetical protein